MKIKKGDTVKILTGKDRAKNGKVLHLLSQSGRARVAVEGLNLRYKHMRAKRERESGQRIQYPAPLDISNVALVCPKCGRAGRVAYRVIAQNIDESSREKKQRVCRHCGAVI